MSQFRPESIALTETPTDPPATVAGKRKIFFDTFGRLKSIATSSSSIIPAISGNISTGNFLTVSNGFLVDTGMNSSNLNSAITGAGRIGPAEDLDYSDGLFADFVTTTPVGTAVDRFNEVLKALAPPPAPLLSNITINDTGVAGKLSFGTSNVISGYTNVPGKDINSTITVGETLSDSSVMRGIFNATTTIDGDLNGSIPVGTGSPSAAYPARAFGDGDSGSIQLWVNGSQVNSVDLTSTTASITSSLNNTTLFVSPSTSVKFPSGTDFSTFKYRTGTWSVSPAAQRNGYNFVEVRRILGSTTTSNRFSWVVDADTTATTFASASMSGLSMTGSKYISGVQYHTGGTASYGITVNNARRNTYSSSGTAISHTETNCTITDSAFGNVANETVSDVISKTATVSTGSRLLNSSISATTSIDRTVQSDLTSTSASITGILLDAISSTSTATTDSFDDENYRVPSNISVTTTSGYTAGGSSPSEWDSTISLVSGISGYSNGLLVENGSLKYPTRGVNSGNYSGIVNGPAGNVNYNGATGNRVYLRFFHDSNPRQNFRFNLSVTSTSFVSVATGPSANNLTFEVLAPNTTTDGIINGVWKDAVVAYTNDNSVGCYSASNGATIPTSWGMTLGGKLQQTLEM
jgi:hypothetical protein